MRARAGDHQSEETPREVEGLIEPDIDVGGTGSLHENVMTVEGNILTIKVDLTKEFARRSKTIIIASTEGNVSVLDRSEKVELNVYRKKP